MTQDIDGWVLNYGNVIDFKEKIDSLGGDDRCLKHFSVGNFVKIMVLNVNGKRLDFLTLLRLVISCHLSCK